MTPLRPYRYRNTLVQGLSFVVLDVHINRSYLVLSFLLHHRVVFHVRLLKNKFGYLFSITKRHGKTSSKKSMDSFNNLSYF